MNVSILAAGCVMALALAGPVAGQPASPKPAAFQKLVDCRAIADSAQRLACFDREVAGLAAAEARQDVVVIDRARVRTARRSLFGLTVPDLGIFGGNDADEDGVSRIDAKIAGVGRTGEGKWTFRLADGARWAQTDTRTLPGDPKVGQPIAIRKAAMGSFLANVDGQTAIRVKRVN